MFRSFLMVALLVLVGCERPSESRPDLMGFDGDYFAVTPTGKCMRLTVADGKIIDYDYKALAINWDTNELEYNRRVFAASANQISGMPDGFRLNGGPTLFNFTPRDAGFSFDLRNGGTRWPRLQARPKESADCSF